LVSEELISLDDQKQWHEDDLFTILDAVIKDAENTLIVDRKYLAIFDIQKESDVKFIWKSIYKMVGKNLSENHQKHIEFLLQNGSLSSRILKSLRGDFTEANIKRTYTKLADSLQNDRMFRP